MRLLDPTVGSIHVAGKSADKKRGGWEEGGFFCRVGACDKPFGQPERRGGISCFLVLMRFFDRSALLRMTGEGTFAEVSS